MSSASSRLADRRHARLMVLRVLVIALATLGGKPAHELVPLLGLFAYAGFRLIPAANRFLLHVDAVRGAAPAIDRLRAHVDGLTIGGADAARELLWPALDDGEAEPARVGSAAKNSIVASRMASKRSSRATACRRRGRISLQRDKRCARTPRCSSCLDG